MIGLLFSDAIQDPAVKEELDQLVVGIQSALSALPTLMPPTFTAWPYVASNFGGSGGMTWTDTLNTQIDYWVSGNLLMVRMWALKFSVGGVPDGGLQLQIPGGYNLDAQSGGTFAYSDNGGGGGSGNFADSVGWWSTFVSSPSLARPIISFFKLDGTNWTASTKNSMIAVTLALKIKV